MAETSTNTYEQDMEMARVAYEKGDLEASRAAHRAKVLSAQKEEHGEAGSEYLRSIVFGGLDGIITTFAVVATVAGANLDIGIIVLMGFSNLIADGISMGFGDYLSSKAEMEFAEREYKREQWELENSRDMEKLEMVELFVKKGMSEDDATKIIDLYSKYDKMYVDLMMYEELGMMPPDEDDSPAKNGAVTFLSFLLFGSVPLWGYVVFVATGYNEATIMFIIACILAGLTMFALGAFKARFTKQNPFKSGAMMLLNGGIAAGAAYLVGYALEAVIGVKTTV